MYLFKRERMSGQGSGQRKRERKSSRRLPAERRAWLGALSQASEIMT